MTAQIDLGLAVLGKHRREVSKEIFEMAWVAGCVNGRHDLGFRHRGGCIQNSSTTQAMADQDGQWAMMITHEVYSMQDICNTQGEVGVGEVAFAGAKAHKVKVQDTKSKIAQGTRHTGGRKLILGTAEAMGKEDKRKRRTAGQVQTGS